MVRDYRDNANKWTDAKITEKTGPLSYKVTTGDQGNWRRHADQMLSTSVERTQPSESTSDVSVEKPRTKRHGQNSFGNNRRTQPARRYPVRTRKPPDSHISERLCK